MQRCTLTCPPRWSLFCLAKASKLSRTSARRAGCEVSHAAVSPLAYLADLLDYAVRHIKNNGQAIDLPFLSATFHQLFGDLPASCEQVDEEVRQVRIAAEVLRGFLANLNLSP